MRIKLPLINKIFVIGFIDLNRIVIGLDSSSFCEEGEQIIVLDYDNLPLEEVREDVKRLQRNFGLPTFYIFSSSPGNYHAYCMTCLKFHEVMVIAFASKSDRNHKNFLLYNKISTVRITRKKGKPSKIRFVEKIPHKGQFREIPNAEELLMYILEDER